MRCIWVALALGAAACTATPPPNWANGGSPLELPRARWERARQLVDIMPDGRVLIDGAHRFSIDAQGRVVDCDATPIAVLQSDGTLVGQDRSPLGTIGMRNASGPKRDTAWLAIGDDGQVTRYRDSGDEFADGKWTACGQAVRTCTLATQIVTLAEARQRSAMMFPTLAGPSVGIGSAGASVVGP